MSQCNGTGDLGSSVLWLCRMLLTQSVKNWYWGRKESNILDYKKEGKETSKYPLLL